jgi:hypothetical protein
MSDPIEARRTKERSPNFPFISLEAALQKAQVLYSHERRSAAPVAAVAKHWGYSETSSGFKQSIGALKNYGLLSDEPGASGRMVRLTELALRILLDARPDSSEKIEYIRQAALSPTIASEVFKRWSDSLPSDHTLSHFLMFDRGFQQEAASKAVKTLRQNAQFAGVWLPAENGFEDEAGTYEEFAATAPSALEAEGRTTSTASARLSVDAPVLVAASRSEKIIDPNGLDVQIQFSGEPTQETYEFLADYVELRLKQFQRKAARSATQPPENDLL